MSAFPLTAPATRVGLSERFVAPDYAREVLMTLRIGDERDAQKIVVPVNDPRSLDTLGKRLPTEYRLTVAEVTP